ncbi:MAG: recombination-associated protein RdgC [Pseudomonadales bacterium]|jgi:recombination associated protein RdgC|nr:recombination-associated protein RdgC [Pseudomonadales bacterium]
MWFRNLRAWRLDAPWKLSTEDLDAQLIDARFSPCGPGQADSVGWEPPVADAPEQLVREVAGRQLLRARIQERILPMAAVTELLPERLAEIEAREGGPVRGARRREVAEGLRAELLPRALLKSTHQWLVIDRPSGLVLVDSATPARGEALLSMLRGCLGSLGVRPLAFTRPLDGTLTTWVESGSLPKGFSLGEWCDLEHPQDTSNKVRFRGQPLDEDEVAATLARGLRVTAVELCWDLGAEAPLRCVLSEDGSLRRLRLPVEDAAKGEDESEAARLDAELALLGMTLERFFAALFPALGGVDPGAASA